MQFRAIIALLLFAASSAFVPSARSMPRSIAVSAGKFNEIINLDSPKVVTMTTLAPGEKKLYCRCWQSGTFPLCDGSHTKHNANTGDNVGPLIVSSPKSS